MPCSLIHVKHVAARTLKQRLQLGRLELEERGWGVSDGFRDGVLDPLQTHGGYVSLLSHLRVRFAAQVYAILLTHFHAQH